MPLDDKNHGFVWEGALGDADRILGLVRNALPFRSVVDVGCGSGAWLATALRHGAERAVGADAPYVTKDMLLDSRIDFRAQDLEQEMKLAERFDLAISLEVAEHLSPERAESFVRDLCALSDCVLFSAAIPGQGGIGHLNERWQSYWAELFERHGYRPVDLVRPAVAGDSEIKAWYRQNILLYLTPAALEKVCGTRTAPPVMLDVALPEFYKRRRAVRPLSRRERLRLAAEIPAITWRRFVHRWASA